MVKYADSWRICVTSISFRFLLALLTFDFPCWAIYFVLLSSLFLLLISLIRFGVRGVYDSHGYPRDQRVYGVCTSALMSPYCYSWLDVFEPFLYSSIGYPVILRRFELRFSAVVLRLFIIYTSVNGEYLLLFSSV